MSSATSVFLTLLLCLPVLTQARSGGQLVITSYSKTQPYYFCDGTGQTSGQNVIYAFVNLVPSVDLVVDSFHFACDRSVFDVSGIDTMKNVDVGAVTTQVAYYTPLHQGDDTLRITAFYGQNTAEGTIVCHAVGAPPIAFYGVENVNQDLGFGMNLGVSDEVLTQDTLHDRFLEMTKSDTAVDLRMYCVNPKIAIRACEQRTIDSVYRVGDTSEIVISGVPPLPYTMHAESALVLSYSLTPRIPGKTPHYLVIHTKEGEYLVWSFEYRVRDNSEVAALGDLSTDFTALVYPNPVTVGSNASVVVTCASAGLLHLRLYSPDGALQGDLGLHPVVSGANRVDLLLPHLVYGIYLLVLDTGHGAFATELNVSP